MIRFQQGQRVRVRRVRNRDNGEPIDLDQAGTVARLRISDAGAFIELDTRSPHRGVHAFPLGDTRERHVLAMPQDCDPLEAWT